MSEPAGAEAPHLAEAEAAAAVANNDENQHEASAEASSTAAGGEAAMMDVELPALPPAAVADDGGDGGMPPPAAAPAAAAAEAAAPAAPPAQAVRYVPFLPSCQIIVIVTSHAASHPVLFWAFQFFFLCLFFIFILTRHASINKRHMYLYSIP